MIWKPFDEIAIYAGKKIYSPRFLFTFLTSWKKEFDIGESIFPEVFSGGVIFGGQSNFVSKPTKTSILLKHSQASPDIPSLLS